MKKCIFSFSLLIIIASSLISGCQEAVTTNEEEKTTLTLWYWTRSLDDNVIQQIKEEFPHITIDAQKIGGDEYKTKVHTSLIADRGPDIVALNDWASQYLSYQDRFVNLMDYGAEEIRKEYLDWKWNTVLDPDTGALIALPIDTGPTALYYRTDLFEEAGLPSDPAEVSAQLQTWDEYIDAAKQMKETTGVKMFDNLERVFNQYVEQQPDKFFTEDEEYIGNEGTVREAWEIASQINQLDLTARVVEGQERNAALNNGDVASFVGAVWESNILKDSAPDTAGEWRVARAPGGDGNNGGSFIGVLNSSDHKEDAVEVIKWLVSSENQLNHYLGVDLFPSAIDTLEADELAEQDPFYGNQIVTEIFSEAAQNVPITYYGEHYHAFRTMYHEELAVMERGGKDTEQAWEDVQKQAERELSRRTTNGGEEDE
ncbi:ABC transporter substrate-binding protein [Shouchella shacheensis]|uniref:ABC transporter substrate-binding protein n=1 Tax=Shouchella shacheensis TaxID=1649580 RepID=UPI00073FD694|nr:ABC transporter substrate-binding protein [Shouchella shacheensis]